MNTVHKHAPVRSENRQGTVENFSLGCIKATNSIVGIYLSTQQYTYTYPQSGKASYELEKAVVLRLGTPVH